MPEIAQGNVASEQDSRPLRTLSIRELNGVSTSAQRIAIPDDKAYNLENIIPIGPQNHHVVPNISASLINYGTDSIYASQGVNLAGTEYLANFAGNGKVFYFNVGAVTSAQVNAGNLLSGAGSQCDQWKNTVTLFIDSTGYYSYDGATFAKITGAGVPSGGDSIAVFAGRVWISSGRTLYFSGADDYTAASWLPANGAGFQNLTDPQIRSKIQRMRASIGYLYLFHSTGVNVISNVVVPIGAVPPTPQYQNTNIQTIIGTDQPASVVPFDRYLLFANRYGAYMMYGISAPKLSEDLNGTWQYLDFSQVISAGQVVVDNILCAAFLLKRANDPTFGSNTVVALWFKRGDKDIWWFANYGAITFIVSTFVNNVAALYGFIGNKLYQLFADATTAPAVNIMTKLYPMEDELARKELLKIGFRAYFFVFGSAITLTADTQTGSFDTNVSKNLVQGPWVNLAGQQGFWINTALIIGGWVTPGPFLTLGDAIPLFDQYVGMTLKSTNYKFILQLLAMDYKLGNRWL